MLEYLSSMQVNTELKLDVMNEEEAKDQRPPGLPAGIPFPSARTETSSVFGQQLPFFQAQGLFEDNTPIPKNRVTQSHIDMYQPPPLGQSHIEDFNPTAHLKLEENVSDDGGDFNPYEEVEEDPLKYKVPVDRIGSINQLWMRIYPSGDDFANSINDCLLEGI